MCTVNGYPSWIITWQIVKREIPFLQRCSLGKITDSKWCLRHWGISSLRNCCAYDSASENGNSCCKNCCNLAGLIAHLLDRVHVWLQLGLDNWVGNEWVSLGVCSSLQLRKFSLFHLHEHPSANLSSSPPFCHHHPNCCSLWRLHCPHLLIDHGMQTCMDCPCTVSLQAILSPFEIVLFWTDHLFDVFQGFHVCFKSKLSCTFLLFLTGTLSWHCLCAEHSITRVSCSALGLHWWPMVHNRFHHTSY